MARTSSRIVVLLIVVLGLAACGSSAEDEGGDNIDPSGREWVLVELDGEPALADVVVDLTVADGQVSGNAGCNRYTGTADVEESSLTVGSEIASTMMACPDEIMAQETAYLTALASVTGYTATEDELQLTTDDGTVVARFN